MRKMRTPTRKMRLWSYTARVSGKIGVVVEGESETVAQVELANAKGRVSSRGVPPVGRTGTLYEQVVVET